MAGDENARAGLPASMHHIYIRPFFGFRAILLLALPKPPAGPATSQADRIAQVYLKSRARQAGCRDCPRQVRLRPQRTEITQADASTWRLSHQLQVIEPCCGGVREPYPPPLAETDSPSRDREQP